MRRSARMTLSHAAPRSRVDTWRLGLSTLAMMTCGCSLWNRPDDGRLRPLDAGPPPDTAVLRDSASADSDLIDSSIDVDAWTDPCSRTQFEDICDNDVDDDCDGLTDCIDPDCDPEPRCCQFPQEQPETFGTVTPPGWDFIPATDALRIETGSNGNGYIDDFGDPSRARAILRRSCVPIALGARIGVDFIPRCANDECSDYASLVLTPINEEVPGIGLRSTFEIRVRGDGDVELYRAGTLLEQYEAMFQTRSTIKLTLQLSPGVDERGDPQVMADMTLQQGAVTLHPYEGSPIFAVDELVGAAFDCRGGDGLFMAIEGFAANCDVDEVRLALRTCDNPSHFQETRLPGATTSGTDLGANASWTAGGLGGPSLQWFTDDWFLMFDAAPADSPRDTESIARVPYRIGASRSDLLAQPNWTALESGEPLDFQASGATREPDFAAAAPNLFHFVMAEAAADDPRTYQIVGGNWQIGGTRISRFELATPSAAVSGGSPSCASYRDPVLLPLTTSPGEYRILVRCERGEQEGTILSFRGPPSWSGTSPGSFEGVVLTRDEFAPYAELDIVSLDGVSLFDRAGSLLAHRLWLIGRDYAGETFVLYAEARDFSGPAPDFHPYALNPILRYDDSRIDRNRCEQAAPGTCALESIGVAIDNQQPNEVVLVIGRRNTSGAQVGYELVWLRQTFPAETWHSSG